MKSKHWGPKLKCYQFLNWRVKLKRKKKLTQESKTKGKKQENKDQIWKIKTKIMDSMMKLKKN